MSDSSRRFRAIHDALMRLFPNAHGNAARYLNVLAALVCGIVGSGKTNLPAIAGEVPFDSKEESIVKRFARWAENEKIDVKTYYLPCAQALLAALAHSRLVLVMDGSLVGRGCISLLVAVVYKKRALPVCWLVVKGKKGHFPEDMHIAVLEQVQPLIPGGADVVLLGDGEFDGVDLQAVMTHWQWKYVCRTAKNIKLYWEGEEFCYEDMGDAIEPGEDYDAPRVLFTEKKYGPVLAIAWWRKDCKEPIYLVTNMDVAKEACDAYAKRFTIETFFSDQKSRGFHLHKSHISDPNRLSRLMIAACLAYYWIIYLGNAALKGGWQGIIHRKKRCDLSLFQLGLRFLRHLLRKGLPLPDAFVEPLTC